MAETIGFLGAGNMGAPMVTNLISAGFGVRIYNRTAEKVRSLVERGAVLAQSPAGAASRGGIVISIVADDAALLSLADNKLAGALGEGGLHISMSTVSPDTSVKLASHHAQFGASFIACPVFGRPEAAAAAKLIICASGPPASRRRAEPVLKAMGDRIFDFGDAAGAANVVKLAGNFLLTAAIEAMAEASALAEKNGVARAALLEMFTQTLFACPIYQNYSKRIIAADFEKVGFAARLALKDMNLVSQTATTSQTPMPTLNVLRDRYLTLLAKGHLQLDASGLAREAAAAAGLKW